MFVILGMIVARLKQEQLQRSAASWSEHAQLTESKSDPTRRDRNREDACACARVNEMVREFSNSGFAKVLVPAPAEDSLAPIAVDVREFVERAGASTEQLDIFATDEFRTFLLQRVLYGYLSATRSANFLDQVRLIEN